MLASAYSSPLQSRPVLHMAYGLARGNPCQRGLSINAGEAEFRPLPPLEKGDRGGFFRAVHPQIPPNLPFSKGGTHTSEENRQSSLCGGDAGGVPARLGLTCLRFTGFPFGNLPRCSKPQCMLQHRWEGLRWRGVPSSRLGA